MSFGRHNSVVSGGCVAFLIRSMAIISKRNFMKLSSFFPRIILISIVVTCQSGMAQTPPDLAVAAQNSSIARPIKEWYAAWETKDWNLLKQNLADGFTFSSPLDDHIDLVHVKDRCWPNAYKIKRFDMEKVVVTGEDTFIISVCWTNEGKWARNCDCFRVKNGKIITYECFFGPGINFPNSGK